MTSNSNISRRDKIKNRINDLECLEEDPLDTQGVLLSDEIQFYSEEYHLIDPLIEDHLEPASYDLSVGKYYSVGEDEIRELSDKPDEYIEIDSFEVAIIQTEEFINMPRFLIGRWNIRVSLAYQGLLWVGGPQVDPGYAGYLYCPIYNLSNEPVSLRRREEIASIDFIKTTPFEIESKYSGSKDYTQEKFERPHSRLLIEDYPTELQSALVTEALQGIEDVSDYVHNVEDRVDSLSQNFLRVGAAVFTIIIVLFTALSIIASADSPGLITTDFFNYGSGATWLVWSMATSVGAIFLSILATIYVFTRN